MSIKAKGFFAVDLLALCDEDMVDVWKEGIEMIKAIQEHMQYCTECREDFDVMLFGNFDEFEKILSHTPLSEWMCEKKPLVEEIGELQSKLSRGEIKLDTPCPASNFVEVLGGISARAQISVQPPVKFGSAEEEFRLFKKLIELEEVSE